MGWLPPPRRPARHRIFYLWEALPDVSGARRVYEEARGTCKTAKTVLAEVVEVEEIGENPLWEKGFSGEPGWARVPENSPESARWQKPTFRASCRVLATPAVQAPGEDQPRATVPLTRIGTIRNLACQRTSTHLGTSL